MKTHQPKSIKEAISDFQEFLECDLYTKFRPEEIIEGNKWYRQDPFNNEKEFIEYLRLHFNILEKQIIKLIGKRKFEDSEISSKAKV